MVYSLPELPVSLPTAVIPEYLDLEAIAKHFESLLEVLTPAHFIQNAVWRDHFALTGSMRSFYGADSVTSAWKDVSKTHSPSSFTVRGKPHLVRIAKHSWVEIGFTFETNGTPGLTCSGFLSVIPNEEGTWNIWMLKTILEGIKGSPSCDELLPATKAGMENGNVNGANGTNGMNGVNGTNGAHGVNSTHSAVGIDFDCVVVGGGQSGLGVGGRLKAMGVSYVILDNHAEVGDNWKMRYDSTKRKLCRSFHNQAFLRH